MGQKVICMLAEIQTVVKVTNITKNLIYCMKMFAVYHDKILKNINEIDNDDKSDIDFNRH